MGKLLKIIENKNLYITFFYYGAITTFVGLFFFKNRFDVSFFLITDYLEAHSLAQTGKLLSDTGLSLITTSLGFTRFAFPSVVLSLLTYIPISPDALLFGVNFSLISFVSFLLVRYVSKNIVEKRYKSLLYTLFFISPVVFSFISESLEFSFLCTSFVLYLVTHNKKLQLFAITVGLFSSFLAVPLFGTTLLFQLIFQKRTKFILLCFILTMLWTLFVIRNNGAQYILDTFPILDPNTHGFYIQTHRQANLALDVPFLGKIFYNKYVFIARSVVEEMFGKLEWDYWVFHTATGKYVSYIPTYAFVGIIELFFIVYGFFEAVRRRSEILLLIVPILLSIVLVKDVHSIELLFYFVLMCLFASGISKFLNNRSPILLYTLFFIIVLSRLVITYHALYSIKQKDTVFRAYSELSKYLKEDNKQSIIITDRLGQPHIYLTYQNVFNITSLQSNMINLTRRDALGYYQPDNIDAVFFRSFKYGEDSDIEELSLEYALVEYEENVPAKVKNEAQIYKQFATEVPYGKTKTNFVFVKR